MDLTPPDLKIHPLENRLVLNGNMQIGNFQSFSHFLCRQSCFLLAERSWAERFRKKYFLPIFLPLIFLPNKPCLYPVIF